MFQSKADSVQLLEDALSVLDIPEGTTGDIGTKQTSNSRFDEIAAASIGLQNNPIKETNEDITPSNNQNFRATASFYSMCNTKHTAMFNESKTTITQRKSTLKDNDDFKGPIPFSKTGSVHKLGRPLNEGGKPLVTAKPHKSAAVKAALIAE